MITGGVLGRLGQAIMKKNSYFIASIFGAAFLSELAIDGGVNAAWEFNNRGKLWKDIEHLCVAE